MLERWMALSERCRRRRKVEEQLEDLLGRADLIQACAGTIGMTPGLQKELDRIGSEVERLLFEKFEFLRKGA